MHLRVLALCVVFLIVSARAIPVADPNANPDPEARPNPNPRPWWYVGWGPFAWGWWPHTRVVYYYR